ncbi:MAG: DUF167 domain-containing protein [Candidatus Pacebacteria bacterium]|nr:DUF167 domain-containing protein [Candidatus Paceibacterota bacterium]
MKYIKIKVFPDFKHTKIVERSPDSFMVYTQAPARDNAANEAVCIHMSNHLGIERGRLRIIKGHRNQNKIIEILADDNCSACL